MTEKIPNWLQILWKTGTMECRIFQKAFMQTWEGSPCSETSLPKAGSEITIHSLKVSAIPLDIAPLGATIPWKRCSHYLWQLARYLGWFTLCWRQGQLVFRKIVEGHQAPSISTGIISSTKKRNRKISQSRVLLSRWWKTSETGQGFGTETRKRWSLERTASAKDQWKAVVVRRPLIKSGPW